MSLTVSECKRIILEGRKQLTAAENRIAELEAGRDTRWFEMFGTPERAARTLVTTNLACDSSLYCSESDCLFKDAPACPHGCGPDDYDALLEWLCGKAVKR